MAIWGKFVDDQNVLNVSVIWHHFTEAEDFEVKASAVSSENKTGRFDILPGHANFISVIYNSLVLYTMEKKQDVYYFTRGIVEVSANDVKLFLEGKID